MAVKLFCDACEEEIKKDELASDFVSFNASYNIKGERSIEKNAQMFCEKCSENIKKYIEKFRGEMTKKK